MTTETDAPVRDSVYQGPDETSAGILTTLETHVKAYNSLKSELAAADGDRDAALENYMENSEDRQAVSLRERIEKATAQLRELAEKNVQEVELSEEDRAKITTEMNAHSEKINASWSTAKKVAELLEIDKDGVLEALEKIGNPTKGSRGRPAGSAGSSVPRASVNIRVTGGQFTDQQFQTFSAMSQALGCTVEAISREYAVAAGVEYEEISKVDRYVEFMFQAKEDGPKYTVKTTPKSRKPRSKAAATVTTNEGPTEAPDFSDASEGGSEGGDQQ